MIYYVIWISTSENYKIISLILLIFYWYLYNLIYIKFTSLIWFIYIYNLHNYLILMLNEEKNIDLELETNTKYNIIAKEEGWRKRWK